MSIFFLVLTALMALIIYFDATRYIIPNWLVGLVIAPYPLMVLMSDPVVPWLTALAVTLGTFAVGSLIFAMRWMGGGDIKLLTACALWTGLSALLDLVMYTALLGGVMALALLALRIVLPRLAPVYAASDRLPRMLQKAAPVPYGLAIAVAFLLLLWQQRLPGLILG